MRCGEPAARSSSITWSTRSSSAGRRRETAAGRGALELDSALRERVERRPGPRRRALQRHQAPLYGATAGSCTMNRAIQSSSAGDSVGRIQSGPDGLISHRSDVAITPGPGTGVASDGVIQPALPGRRARAAAAALEHASPRSPARTAPRPRTGRPRRRRSRSTRTYATAAHRSKPAGNGSVGSSRYWPIPVIQARPLTSGTTAGVAPSADLLDQASDEAAADDRLVDELLARAPARRGRAAPPCAPRCPVPHGERSSQPGWIAVALRAFAPSWPGAWNTTCLQPRIAASSGCTGARGRVDRVGDGQPARDQLAPRWPAPGRARPRRPATSA